jgi:hypothetical protein
LQPYYFERMLSHLASSAPENSEQKKAPM